MFGLGTLDRVPFLNCRFSARPSDLDQSGFLLMSDDK